MIRSRFVYDRSLTDDLARVLAAARAGTWLDEQLIMIDWIAREFAEQAHDHDHQFDVERFLGTAKFNFGYSPRHWAGPRETAMPDPPAQGGQQWQIVKSSSSETSPEIPSSASPQAERESRRSA